jgi:hypothetical protein
MTVYAYGFVYVDSVDDLYDIRDALCDSEHDYAVNCSVDPDETCEIEVEINEDVVKILKEKGYLSEEEAKEAVKCDYIKFYC